jgi:hypothetical protein
VQGAAGAKRGCDHQDAGDDEVGDLNPSEVAIAEHANRVASEVESGPDEHLD